MKVSVLGAGSMGTATGALIARGGVDVTLWCRRGKVCKDIMEHHVNSEYLPGIELPPNLRCNTGMSYVLKNTDVIVFAIPSHALVDVLQEARKASNRNLVSLSVIKGLVRPSTRMFPSEEIVHIIQGDVAVLAGPTFASEIAQRKPTVLTLASESKHALEMLRPLLETDAVKVTLMNDVRGVEACSVLKNVYAIALGIVDGLGLGDNTRGVVIHSALNEMRQILSMIGGKPETLFSPAGVSDFICTSFSNKSRNRTLGALLGLGIVRNNGLIPGIISEGKKAVFAIQKLSAERHLSVPVLEFVDEVCRKEITPLQAFRKLEMKIFWNREIA